MNNTFKDGKYTCIMYEERQKVFMDVECVCLYIYIYIYIYMYVCMYHVGII